MEFKGQYDFLSNFFVCPVNYGGTQWKTSEHAYQAAKACFDGDRFLIQDAATPAFAKRLGRAVAAVPGWAQRRRGVMLAIIRAKFADPVLAEKLANVRGEIIEHNTWHDNYWGSCQCAACRGRGENHLGHILMQVRDEIRSRREQYGLQYGDAKPISH